MSARVEATYRLDYLVVLSVQDGAKDLERIVVPLSRGRGVLQRQGLEVNGSPRISVRFAGFVVAPAGVALSVYDVSTQCHGGHATAGNQPGDTSCRTVGRVHASDGGSWLSVVQVDSTLGDRHWGLARVTRGEGPFTVAWKPSGAGAVPGVTAKAVGIVGHSPKQ